MASAPAPAEDLLEECTEVARIALASAGRNRSVWLAAFALDGRIGRMVLGASEPLLGQMRLAWWRDQLALPESARPQGDPLLDLIGTEWAGHERALSDLVDGWEALLGERPLSEPAMQEFWAGGGWAGWPNACCNPKAPNRLRRRRVFGRGRISPPMPGTLPSASTRFP